MLSRLRIQHEPSSEGTTRPWCNLKLQAIRTSSSTTPGQSVAASAGQDICLSPLSQFFLNVENPPDIYAIMTLDGYCRLDELVAPMQHMADLHDRFRRRVVYSFGAWTAEMLEDFDVRTMMKEVTLDGPDAEQAFHNYMGQLMTRNPLGMDGLPPWDVWCIHYACDPNRTDVLMRASHIIGDGQLFMKIIKQIMQPLNAAAAADYAASVPGAADCGSDALVATGQGLPGLLNTRSKECEDCSSGSSTCSRDSSDDTACLTTCNGTSSASSLGELDSSSSSDSDNELQQSEQKPLLCRGDAGTHRMQEQQQQQQQHRKERRRNSPPAQQQWQEQAQRCQKKIRLKPGQQLRKVFVSLLRFLTMCWNGYTALLFTALFPFWFADPVTAVKASPDQCAGPRRWSSHTTSLSEFYRTAKLLGTSVNTLAVTCLAGGIRRYLLKHGEVPANRVRLCSMVDTRSMPGLLTGTTGNSNNFSFIGVPLFTGDCRPLERLLRVGGAMCWIRHSLAVPLAIRMPSILQFFLRSPAWSTWAVLCCLPWKATIGFSNMKGPQGRWSLSGYPVVRIHNGVQPMAFGCFVSLFSYGDTLTFTHTCYTSKTESPQLLLSSIMAEYDALRKAAAITGSLDSKGCSEPESPGGRIKAA